MLALQVQNQFGQEFQVRARDAQHPRLAEGESFQLPRQMAAARLGLVTQVTQLILGPIQRHRLLRLLCRGRSSAFPLRRAHILE